ncbi:hypothetical protein [Pseudomonas aeruginosa]|uniref:hypothetical protein n=1 Tax=Pseudomonas aeruginosa TaxID=287 RepID=UPI0021AD8283|nr:hypothetical protein [Pseudomonas aeruginosa]
MIKPTVGRVLWFWPSPEDRCARIEGQPLAAIVAHAWSDTCVNLAYFDANGVHRHKTSVLLVQEGAQRPAAGFAEWMPYQKGQATKTEAVQREAVDALLQVRVPILDQIAELCWAIEKCGASPELTDAVTKASALREPISELVRQALVLGIGDGIVSVNVSPEPSPAARDAVVTSQVVTAASLAPAVSLLLASADCCDTNAAARDDGEQAEQDRVNAASYRLAASLLQA